MLTSFVRQTGPGAKFRWLHAREHEISTGAGVPSRDRLAVMS